MNILHINTSDAKGGAAQIAYTLHKKAESSGHNSSMLVGRKYSDDGNVFLIRKLSYWRDKLLRKASYILADDIDFPSAKAIFKMEVFQNADIIHCHNLHSYYFSLKNLIKISSLKPIVWTFHDMWPITSHCANSYDGRLNKNGFYACPSNDIYPPIAWNNEKSLIKKKTKIYKNSEFHIVTPSLWLNKKIVGTVLENKQRSVIYNGIDTTTFRPQDKNYARKKLGLPLNKKIALFSSKGGQSNQWKGGEYFSKMANIKKDVLFLSVGEYEDGISGNIHNISYVHEKNILAQYYAASDVFFYPSLADNCPISVLQALAVGVPVVCFETGGIPELVDHNSNGYIARYGNFDDLKNGFEIWIDKGKTNIQPKYFDENRMFQEYLSLYSKILRESK